MKPRNPEQALTLALVLGVTAPDSQRAAACIRSAEKIAADVDPVTVQAVRDAVEVCLNVLVSEA